MAITTGQVEKLNRMNKTAHDVQLGTLIQAAEAVTAGEITLAEAKILVGSASGVGAAVSLAGDATIVAAGTLTIANDAITTVKILNANVTAAKLATDAVETAKIKDANVTLAKLASGITPSHVVKYAGKFTTVGGDATEVITVTGVASTDVVHVTLQTKGAAPVTVLEAIPTTNTITVTMSGDPSTDHILAYSVLRAAA